MPHIDELEVSGNYDTINLTKFSEKMKGLRTLYVNNFFPTCYKEIASSVTSVEFYDCVSKEDFSYFDPNKLTSFSLYS